MNDAWHLELWVREEKRMAAYLNGKILPFLPKVTLLPEC